MAITPTMTFNTGPRVAVPDKKLKKWSTSMEKQGITITRIMRDTGLSYTTVANAVNMGQATERTISIIDQWFEDNKAA